MHELMQLVNSGKGGQQDIELMQKLGNVMSIACLCGLGQAAPAPVLTTIKHFGTDYNAKLM